MHRDVASRGLRRAGHVTDDVTPTTTTTDTLHERAAAAARGDVRVS